MLLNVNLAQLRLKTTMTMMMVTFEHRTSGRRQPFEDTGDRLWTRLCSRRVCPVLFTSALGLGLAKIALVTSLLVFITTSFAGWRSFSCVFYYYSLYKCDLFVVTSVVMPVLSCRRHATRALWLCPAMVSALVVDDLGLGKWPCLYH